MKSRITKLAAAVVIIIAVVIALSHFGGSIDGASVAWAELVARVEQSHDKYMGELLLAVEEKDSEKMYSCANLLSEYWQRLGWLAGVELIPKQRAEMLARIAEERAVYESHPESDDIGVQIFLAHADQFSDWLGKIEDVTWITETIHVCKQMEEYLEEIRDAGRRPELDLSYAEHCLPSFIAYCEWFEQLPWDNPGQYMTPATLLTGIGRDLKIARREIESLQIKDADRYIKRCLQQAQKNVLDLDKKTQPSRTNKQRDLCSRLARRIDVLSDFLVYAQFACWDIQETYQIQQDEALLQVMAKEFANKGPFADYFIEQVDQVLDLCEQLSKELEPMR